MNALRTLIVALCAPLLAAVMVLLGIAISLTVTVLNADFVIAGLDNVPVERLFADEAKRQVPPEAAFLLPVIDQAAGDLEPWAREQMAVLVQALERYVKGKLAFSATISLTEPKQYIADHLQDALLDSGLPGIELLSQPQLKTFADQIMALVDSRIPDELEITEAYLDAGTLSGIRMARQYTGYVTWSLRLLPVVAVLLVLLIAALQSWRARRTTRLLGAVLLVAGLTSLVLRLVAASVLPGLVPADIPPELNPALSAFTVRFVEPLLIYGVVVMVVGMVLLLLSFRLGSAEA